MKTTYQQFKKVYSETFFVKPQKIHLHNSFKKELKMNELEFNEMLVSMENYFHIEIPDQELSNLKSVKDIVNCIESLLSQN